MGVCTHVTYALIHLRKCCRFSKVFLVLIVSVLPALHTLPGTALGTAGRESVSGSGRKEGSWRSDGSPGAEQSPLGLRRNVGSGPERLGRTRESEPRAGEEGEKGRQRVDAMKAEDGVVHVQKRGGARAFSCVRLLSFYFFSGGLLRSEQIWGKCSYHNTR